MVSGAVGRRDFDLSWRIFRHVLACHPKARGREDNESGNAPRCARVGLAAPLVAQAQPAWPPTVRFIVPFPPGQAADIFARLMAERLTEIWKQQVVVDNKGGGSGIPGVEDGKAAAPDGYTPDRDQRHFRRQSQPLCRPALQAACRLPADHQHHHGAADHRRPSEFPGEHAGRADRARAQGAGQALLCLGRPGHGAASSWSCSSSWRSSTSCTSPTRARAGPADLLGGHVKLMMDFTASALGAIRDGRIKALGVTTARRAAGARPCRRSVTPCPATTPPAGPAWWRRRARR